MSSRQIKAYVDDLFIGAFN